MVSEVRPSMQRLCLANACTGRRAGPPPLQLARSLLWKRRLGNLKSSWVTSALLLFFTLLAPKKATLPRTAGKALVLVNIDSRRETCRTETVTTLGYPVGKPLPVPRPLAATALPAPCPPSPPTSEPSITVSTSVELRGC